MSTRSDIIVQRADGKWHRIYCHSDGYLSHNGQILFDHYNSQAKAESLVQLGDLSLLGPEIGVKHPFEGPSIFYRVKTLVIRLTPSTRKNMAIFAAPMVATVAKRTWPGPSAKPFRRFGRSWIVGLSSPMCGRKANGLWRTRTLARNRLSVSAMHSLARSH